MAKNKVPDIWEPKELIGQILSQKISSSYLNIYF